MKNYILVLSIALVSSVFMVSSCCEDDDGNQAGYCSAEGIIISQDYRKCFCCGGWFIEIDGDTLRAPVLPEEFRAVLDLNEFPLPVYLEWSPYETPCLGDEIEVPCIRQR